MGYNSVADNTGLSSFVLPLLSELQNHTKVPEKFVLTAVWGHRFWCQSKVQATTCMWQSDGL